MTKKKKKSGPGRPPKHGGYSFLVKGELPENRKYIRDYLTAAREGLISDLGSEENLTTAQMVLIDRAIGILGIIRCMEAHIQETSVISGDDLSPCLRTSFLSYCNSLRLIFRELGIDKRITDDLNLRDYLESKRKEKGAANVN